MKNFNYFTSEFVSPGHPDKISEAISKIFDLSPRGIEKALELREGKFKYQNLAAYGHIGRTDIDTPF